MDMNSNMPAFFKPQDIEGTVAMTALKCAVNLLTSAKNMYFDGDDTNCEPVTLLICTVTVATQPIADHDELHSRFFEVEAMLRVVETAADASLHPHRRGLLACARNLCEAGRKVADGGFGLASDQIWPEQMLNLLMPFMPDQVEVLGERISAERARRQTTEAQHG